MPRAGHLPGLPLGNPAKMEDNADRVYINGSCLHHARSSSSRAPRMPSRTPAHIITIMPSHTAQRTSTGSSASSDTSLFRFGDAQGESLHLILDGCGTFTAVFHPDTVLQHIEEHHLNDFPDAGERVTVH